jgi:hypothetical protein
MSGSMNVAIPGLDCLIIDMINALNRRCDDIENQITALHNTLCLLSSQLNRPVAIETKQEPAPPDTDNEGWTVVERRRGR